MNRINKRNMNNHVLMSREVIKKVNKLSINENYHFDLVIENENSSDDKIVETFQKLL